MTLFQVIQESVDTIYFLEEDTISTANVILDSVLKHEIKGIVREVIAIVGNRTIDYGKASRRYKDKSFPSI